MNPRNCVLRQHMWHSRGQACYIIKALRECKTTTETQQKFELAKETKGHYEKLQQAYRSDRVALREQNDLIHRLQTELEKANERVSALSLKCQEHSKENEKLKIEHVDAMKDKGNKLETIEKDKVDLLLMQQHQLSEAGSSKE